MNETKALNDMMLLIAATEWTSFSLPKEPRSADMPLY